MKKLLIVGAIALLFLTGCVSKEEEKELTDILYDAGERAFGDSEFHDGTIDVGSKHSVDLKFLIDNYGVDKAKFRKCNKEKTKVEFIVKEPSQPNVTNYKINVKLDC